METESEKKLATTKSSQKQGVKPLSIQSYESNSKVAAMLHQAAYVTMLALLE